MNSEFPHSDPEDPEARITAFLLGELPPAEAAEVQRDIAHDPDLARLQARLARTIDLVREASRSRQAQASTAAAPLRLSNERREVLLAAFRTTTPGASAVRPKPEQRWWSRPALALAASLVVLLAAWAVYLRMVVSQRWEGIETASVELQGLKDGSLIWMIPGTTGAQVIQKVWEDADGSSRGRERALAEATMQSRATAVEETLAGRPVFAGTEVLRRRADRSPKANERGGEALAQSDFAMPAGGATLASALDAKAEAPIQGAPTPMEPRMLMRYGLRAKDAETVVGGVEETAKTSSSMTTATKGALAGKAASAGYPNALTDWFNVITNQVQDVKLADGLFDDTFHAGFAVAGGNFSAFGSARGRTGGGMAGGGGFGGGGGGGGSAPIANVGATETWAVQPAAQPPAGEVLTDNAPGFQTARSPLPGKFMDGVIAATAAGPAERPTDGIESRTANRFNTALALLTNAPAAPAQAVTQERLRELTAASTERRTALNRTAAVPSTAAPDQILGFVADFDSLAAVAAPVAAVDNGGVSAFFDSDTDGPTALERSSAEKVPVLGDTPLLGQLFVKEPAPGDSVSERRLALLAPAPTSSPASADIPLGRQPTVVESKSRSESERRAGESARGALALSDKMDRIGSGGVLNGMKPAALDKSDLYFRERTERGEAVERHATSLGQEAATRDATSLLREKRKSRSEQLGLDSAPFANDLADIEGEARAQHTALELGRGVALGLEASQQMAKVEEQEAVKGIADLNGREILTAPALAEAEGMVSQVVAAPPVPQPEVLSAENNFSTFSLNVADVTFKLAAASLEAGQLPDPASIRVEEFVNAFDYHDPEPAGDAPIAFTWERASYPFAHNRDVLRFSVQTAARGREAGQPLNLVLLLDNSGSMERADRVRITREALHVLGGQLQPQDKISVVAFARNARLWVDGMPGSEAHALPDRVGDLTPEGGTNLEDALRVGYETARRHFQSGGVNRVILLTDGAANLGVVAPEALKAMVEEHRRGGVALDGFGIGWEGYNDNLLEALTRNGDGRYGFVNTPEEAASGFADQLAGALQVAAADVKAQVEFNPARVTNWRQVGYARHQLTQEQFRDNTVDAAEIGAAESGNALYVVEVNPQGQGPLGVVRVRYRVPTTGQYREHEWALEYDGPALPLEQTSAPMRLANTAAAFGEMLSGSPYAAEVNSERLLALLGDAPRAFEPDPRPPRLEWMLRQAQALGGR